MVNVKFIGVYGIDDPGKRASMHKVYKLNISELPPPRPDNWGVIGNFFNCKFKVNFCFIQIFSQFFYSGAVLKIRRGMNEELGLALA